MNPGLREMAQTFKLRWQQENSNDVKSIRVQCVHLDLHIGSHMNLQYLKSAPFRQIWVSPWHLQWICGGIAMSLENLLQVKIISYDFKVYMSHTSYCFIVPAKIIAGRIKTRKKDRHPFSMQHSCWCWSCHVYGKPQPLSLWNISFLEILPCP